MRIKQKSITIKDVAQRAGVAQSTVSLVINKKHTSERTKRKVLKAIRELNYHPTRLARGLATQKTGNIGFIVSDTHFSRAEPFYTRIFLGTEFEARQYNYYVLLTTVGEEFDPSESVPRFLVEKNVDGVILAGKVNDSLIFHIEKGGLPMVLIDYLPKNSKIASVLIDNVHGAYEAVCHLITLGHKRIGFIGGSIDHPSISGRLEGYKQAMNEFNLPISKNWIVEDEPYTSVDDGYQATKKLLKSSPLPTAIFASNDTMAIGSIRALKEAELNVPKDISIVGFDDIEEASHVDPPLTTMRVFKEEMGVLGVKKLMDMIDTGNIPKDKTLVPVELVTRSSCEKNKYATN